MYYGVLLFLNLGTPEIILIVFVALLLFGGKKLPELARGLGKGIREFKDASDGVKREIHRNINTLTAEEELRRDEAAAQRSSSMSQQTEEGVASTETEQTIKP